MNENENTATPNLCDSVKAVLRGRFIAIQTYLKKQEKNQINNLTVQLVRNRFKGLDLIGREPDELWTEVHDIV